MRKIVVILLVLFLVGCIPQPSKVIKGGRGLDIEFLPRKPRFDMEDGDKVLRVGKEFYVGLKLINPTRQDIGGEISVRNLGRYASNIDDYAGFFVERALVEGEERVISEEVVEFGPYVYSKEIKLGDTLSVTVTSDYTGFVISEMCFPLDGSDCREYEEFGRSFFEGDLLPVDIDKIVKDVDVSNNGVELDIYFKNFEQGEVEENRIDNFYVDAVEGNVALSCDNTAVFEDNEAKISCTGSVSDDAKGPIEIEFGYKYIVKMSLNYKVLE